jgi:hypothetical protein
LRRPHWSKARFHFGPVAPIHRTALPPGAWQFFTPEEGTTVGGTDGLFPTLKGSALVQSLDPASVLHVVLRGARSVATDPAPTAAAMPSFGWTLTDFEVAAVSTYVRNAWGNRAPPVDTATVTKTRRTLEERAD